jgi:hypothetical protein
MTAERQNRVVVLLIVNVLAAAQTYRHVSGGSRLAGVIEQPMFGRGVLQPIHFAAGLDPKPAFPSRWRAPGSIGGGLRGIWYGRSGARGRLRVPASRSRERRSGQLIQLAAYPHWWIASGWPTIHPKASSACDPVESSRLSDWNGDGADAIRCQVANPDA